MTDKNNSIYPKICQVYLKKACPSGVFYYLLEVQSQKTTKPVKNQLVYLNNVKTWFNH